MDHILLGDGYASGMIDLGGLLVCQISSFNKVWATHEGGPGNLGASFFEPSPLPHGFYMLGCYSQPNNIPFYGWALAAKPTKDNDDDPSSPLLRQPVDFTLIWSSEFLNIKKDGNGYVWLPTASDGYKAIGLVVTSSPEKPSLDKIRCVRSSLTDECEADLWIWGPGTASDANGFNVFSVRPSNRGTSAMGVFAGTFIAAQQNGGLSTVACLKNAAISNPQVSMPNLTQIEALLEAYSPFIYFHPDEVYLPSVNVCVLTVYFNGGFLQPSKMAENVEGISKRR
ncbi:hypothetical protein D8674_030083 [Pyrus ussuriensis x Pyrus communis]|uniref:Uncharacterized protein n=1 Tax=Pyrus ussuriensis x Pyrus communis TaxID=2448454 RepID=A0A5N5EVS4_9ROSA|nr:hypothetical protein D8674_030083 [Pyrus ussuriensis x Pyrus communis]